LGAVEGNLDRSEVGIGEIANLNGVPSEGEDGAEALIESVG
jgi:hypothetical protein